MILVSKQWVSMISHNFPILKTMGVQDFRGDLP
jgi:hypothetical protein